MSRRRMIHVGAALAIVPVLAGCSLLESGRVLDILGDDTAIRQELSTLVDTIGALPGIAGVESEFDPNAFAEADGAEHTTTQLHLRVEVADGTDLRELAEAARVAFSSVGLRDTTASLDVSDDSGPVLAQRDFSLSASVLERNIALRADVSETIHQPILLRLGGDLSPAALVSFEEAALGALVEHYDEIIHTSLPADDGVSWQFPGLTAIGTLPPVEFVRVVAEVAETVPLQPSWGAGDSAPGFSLWVAGGGVAPLYALRTGDDADVWDSVVVAARAISDAGVEPASFEHSTPAAYAAVHFGECPGGVADGQYDPRFVDALAAEGVPVTTATNLGICERIAQ